MRTAIRKALDTATAATRAELETAERERDEAKKWLSEIHEMVSEGHLHTLAKDEVSCIKSTLSTAQQRIAELERERDALLIAKREDFKDALLSNDQAMLLKALSERDRLAEQVRALGEDKARLDWLEQNKEIIFCLSWEPRTGNWTLCNNPTDSIGGAEIVGESADSVRGCLDAARTAAQEGAGKLLTFQQARDLDCNDEDVARMGYTVSDKEGWRKP